MFQVHSPLARPRARFDRASRVALLCVLCACTAPSGPAARTHKVIQAEGEHAVETAGEAKLVQLRLKSGFAVSLEPSKSALRVGPVRLAVAEPRATSEQIARGFVPVGPTVVLSAQSGPLEVSFVADGFHVRAGHRLVLAVERALPCQLPGGCRSWRLEPAQYRAGRCLAELPTPGLRLQFGSLPAVLSDSAAP